MPTIPTRDAASAPTRKPFTRSPGRAYSMSRLDQLAKPRKRPELPAVAETASSQPFRPLSRPQQSSVSRSMSHLAVSKLGPPQSQRPLSKSDSRSMHQLSLAAPLPPPRTTRATRLRQQKLAVTNTSSEGMCSVVSFLLYISGHELLFLPNACIGIINSFKIYSIFSSIIWCLWLLLHCSW